ncbi:MAG TPA: hypothetical protein VKU94_04125 [Geobacterales bacterium]|nr:hypothetical protein [Geobacterales bacterium]
MSSIEDIRLRVIFDSRGDKTVEAEVITKSSRGVASCPAGASKSIYEVETIPKEGLNSAITDFNKKVKPKLLGIDVRNQEEIDSILIQLDGTERLEKYGAAIILSVSIAVLKAAAMYEKKAIFEYIKPFTDYSLPRPLGNIIGGGKHARGRSIDIQEILVFCENASSIEEAIEANIKMHRKLFKLLSINDPNFAGGKNDEGALVTRMPLKKVLSLVKQAKQELEKEDGKKMIIGLDVAASSLWNGSKYEYSVENKTLTESEQMEFISRIIEDFDIYYVEDPFHEDAFNSFSELQEKYKDVLVVGDDLFASNEERLRKGIINKVAKGIIIKPNQVGTITRITRTIKTALDNGIKPIVSHRSGETEDNFIAHLATAYSAPLIKTGTIGGERVVKLNELIRIAEYLGPRAKLGKL